MFCTVEANYTDRHEASRGLFATAELLVKLLLLLDSVGTLQQGTCYIFHHRYSVSLHYLVKKNNSKNSKILTYLTQYHHFGLLLTKLMK